MASSYIKELFKTAAESAVTEDTMIEVLVVLLLFFVPFSKKLKPLAKSEQSVRKILFWKFWMEPEWRIAAVVTILFILHCGFLSPMVLYNQSQCQIKSLEQETNELSHGLEVSKEHIRLDDSGAGNLMRDRAIKDFKAGFYGYACDFFAEYYTAYPSDMRHSAQTPETQAGQALFPLYLCSILRSNSPDRGSTNGYPPELLNRFEQEFQALTNHIGTSAKDNDLDSFNNSENLRQIIDNLVLIYDRVPYSETQFVATTIATISKLRENIKANKPKTS